MKFEESMLSGYIDGELTPAERDVVERHLATNAKDRDLLRSLTDLHRKLRAVPEEVFLSDPVAGVRKRIAAGPASVLDDFVADRTTTDVSSDKPAGANAKPATSHGAVPAASADRAHFTYRLAPWIALAVAASVLFLLMRSPIASTLSQLDSEGVGNKVADSPPAASRGVGGALTKQAHGTLVADEEAAMAMDTAPTDPMVVADATNEFSPPPAANLLPPDSAMAMAADSADGADGAELAVLAEPQSTEPLTLTPRYFIVSDQLLDSDEEASNVAIPQSLLDELAKRFVAVELPADTDNSKLRFAATQLAATEQANKAAAAPATLADGAEPSLGPGAENRNLERSQAAESNPISPETLVELLEKGETVAVLVESDPQQVANLIQSIGRLAAPGESRAALAFGGGAGGLGQAPTARSGLVRGGRSNSSDLPQAPPSATPPAESPASPPGTTALQSSAIDVGPEGIEAVHAGRVWLLLRRLPSQQ